MPVDPRGQLAGAGLVGGLVSGRVGGSGTPAPASPGARKDRASLAGDLDSLGGVRELGPGPYRSAAHSGTATNERAPAATAQIPAARTTVRPARSGLRTTRHRQPGGGVASVTLVAATIRQLRGSRRVTKTRTDA